MELTLVFLLCAVGGLTMEVAGEVPGARMLVRIISFFVMWLGAIPLMVL